MSSDKMTANEFLGRKDFQDRLKRFENPERETWQKPDLILESLGDLSGRTVADIGAGSGYFAFRLAPLAARVIAVETDADFVTFLEDRKSGLPEEIRDSVEIRAAVEEDPRLAPNEADWVITVNTFHHFENRIDYLGTVIKGIKPGGALVVVDYKMGDWPVGPPDHIKVSLETVLAELKAAGFREIRVNEDILPYQFMLIAER